MGEDDLHLSDDGEESSEFLMDHESEDSHHGGTTVVQLDGTLGQLGLLVEGVPAEVDGAVAEVADEFVLASDVLHDSELEESNEGENLGKAGRGDGIRAEEGGNAVGVGGEGMSRVVDVAREVDAGAGHDLAKEGELADPSVLELDEAEAVESLLVGVIEQAEGIEEAERRLGSELGLEGVEGRGGLGHGSGGERGGRADKGSENGGLHVCKGKNKEERR